MGTPENKGNRNLAFDMLNIIACLGVVSLHHNGLVHSFDGGTAGWVQSLIVECVCYCSVPLFMLLCGANLLGYTDKYTTSVFFRKRFWRTVFPWLFWSVIFLVWRKEPLLESYSWQSVLDAILNNKVVSVYWFFNSLFTCYLAMPFLSSMRKNRRVLWYIVGVLFFFYSCKPFLSRWAGVNWSLAAPLAGNLLIYVVLGYLLTTRQPKGKKALWLYVVGIAGVVFRFFYTWYWSVQKGTTDTSIKDYAAFHSVVYACAVFVLGCKIPWDRILPEWLKKRIPDISACSFGVFLIHRRIMEFESQLLGIGNRQFIWRSICIPLTYFVCLMIVWGIRKIPGIRRVVGG